MNGVKDISYLELSLGFLLILIPIFIFIFYKTKLLKDTLIAISRMTIQLLLVGFYLEFIFKLNYWWLNISWAIIMIMIASYSVIKRSKLSFKYFIFPVFIGIFTSILIIDAYFFGLIVKLDYFLDARYFIPITGMLLGNSIKNNIIALNNYYGRIKKEQILYKFLLANGATKNEALMPFMREAMRVAFNPIIANTAVIGLISLPGMMTGQILGGSMPSVAIKYQILLVLTIFVADITTVFITILIANRFVFDKFDILKKVN